MGFAEAAQATGLSKSFLRNAVKDPDPARRLRTVRVNRRRLIREEDLTRMVRNRRAARRSTNRLNRRMWVDLKR